MTATDWLDAFFALPGCGVGTVDFLTTHKCGTALCLLFPLPAAANTPPLPGASTAFAAKTPPLPCQPTACRG